LPYRHHDLIYLRLPGLRAFLERLAPIDPTLAKECISEAAASAGQKTIAKVVITELQARDLERAARNRLFTRAAALDFPYLPHPHAARTDHSLASILVFQSAAQDLIAGGSSQRQRRIYLDRAYDTIERFHTTIATTRRPDPLARRLVPTAALWLDVLREERRRLARQAAKNPEIPAAFIAGSALTPSDTENRPLFKGRDDVIKLIQHDLSPNRRGVLLVIGQRRMGKTSLRNYLPTYLGTNIVAVSDFQPLSGDPHRATPHLRILSAITSALPTAPPPPTSAAWGDALSYLQALDRTLTDRTLFVVIDEVERLEDGIRAGWTTPDFLDFLRACGDSLRRIRFLLLTAYPLHRLGPHWVDHLVSVTSRTISYLDERDARELMVAPIPDFPDIYPPGGVDQILTATGRHPYLLQKVGDELVRLLNAERRRKATDADLEKVFDAVVTGADLFDELWRQRTDDERAALRRMAAAGAPIEPDAAALQLVREGYVEKRDGKVSIAVPLFREWIADTQGAG
jgi:hypothetical protein